MNIALINADSIFWEADKNIRTVDFRSIFSKIEKIFTPDQIYLIGGLEETDPFNESLKDILRANDKKPIIPVSSITATTPNWCSSTCFTEGCSLRTIRRATVLQSLRRTLLRFVRQLSWRARN